MEKNNKDPKKEEIKKSKKERDENIYNGVLQRSKKLDVNYNLISFVMLLLPSALLAGICFLAPLTYFASFLLIIPILPMFLAVEKRIKYMVSGIGKKEITYADGYSAMFKSNASGTFGVLTSILISLALFILCFFCFGNLLAPLCNLFDGSKEAYITILDAMESDAVNLDDFVIIVSNNITHLMQPLSLIISISLFIPLFFLFMFVFPENLSHHYLSTIVLPDVDINLSASQGRALIRSQCSRSIIGERAKINFRTNWLFFVIFVLLYGLSSYLTSLIRTDNIVLSSMLMFLTPAIAAFYGPILSYCTLFSHYEAIEELKTTVKENINNQFAIIIYQAYTNPSYVHREESFARGCFVDVSTSPYFTNNSSFDNMMNNLFGQNQNQNKQNYQASYTETKEEEKPVDDQPSKEGTTAFVDLSDDSNSDENK